MGMDELQRGFLTPFPHQPSQSISEGQWERKPFVGGAGVRPYLDFEVEI